MRAELRDEFFSRSLITALVGAIITFVLAISMTFFIKESFQVVVLVSAVGSIVTFLTLLVDLLIFFKIYGK